MSPAVKAKAVALVEALKRSPYVSPAQKAAVDRALTLRALNPEMSFKAAIFQALEESLP